MTTLDKLEQQARASNKTSDWMRWQTELLRSIGLFTSEQEMRIEHPTGDATIGVTFLKRSDKSPQKPSDE